MENIYNYLFWHNFYENLWYAIPRDKLTEFFNGNKKAEGVKASTKIETLIAILNNPTLVETDK